VIRALRLGNFKAFAEAQRLPIRPLTLVFGPNSAGKSTLLHALALAHHALETGDLDAKTTNLGGSAIDLGGFRQYVHGRDPFAGVHWAFELGGAGDIPRLAESPFAEMQGIGVAVEIRLAQQEILERRTVADKDTNGPTTVDVPTGRYRASGEPRVRTVTYEVERAPLLRMSRRGDGLFAVDRLFTDNPALPHVFETLATSFTTAAELSREDLQAMLEAAADVATGLSAVSGPLLPERLLSSPRETDADREAAILPVRRGGRGADLLSALATFLPRALDALVRGVAEATADRLERLTYLGPLRSYPPRHVAFAEPQDLNWHAGGGHAWEVVRDSAEVREKVNAWLRDAERLQTPYELTLRELIASPELAGGLEPHIRRAHHDLAAEILRQLGGAGEPPEDLARLVKALGEQLGDLEPGEARERLPELEEWVEASVDTEALAEVWEREIVAGRAEVLRDLVLVDTRTQTVLSHRDVGIGISQVLPVLVTAYASHGRLLAVEQPEIHLHPALQAELGDVFIESALGEGGNTLLVETHSEHLILRILRRIRETTDGELPQGLTPVDPEQVAVIYIQPGDDGARVLHIPVTEDGEFERPWPQGFFPERARELF
jgi:ABC-type ATPase involved in cell division